MKISRAFTERHAARSTGQAAQPEKECILDVEIPQQALTEWCWAAVTVGIAAAYRDTTETQCQVASRVCNSLCCPDGDNPDSCNLPLEQLELALKNHGRPPSTDSLHRQKDFVIAQINAGLPIAVFIDWGTGGSGHYLVIRGYRIMRDGAFDLHVCDPHIPSVAAAPLPFAHVLSYFHQQGTWTKSYETKGAQPVPKKP
jgi:hypothetical protein